MAETSVWIQEFGGGHRVLKSGSTVKTFYGEGSKEKAEAYLKQMNFANASDIKVGDVVAINDRAFGWSDSGAKGLTKVGYRVTWVGDGPNSNIIKSGSHVILKKDVRKISPSSVETIANAANFEAGRMRAQNVLACKSSNALDTPSDKAFDEGYRAAKKGHLPTTNPYPSGNLKEDWLDGYRKAERDFGKHSAFRKA